jgi:hypothetical protein
LGVICCENYYLGGNHCTVRGNLMDSKYYCS